MWVYVFVCRQCVTDKCIIDWEVGMGKLHRRMYNIHTPHTEDFEERSTEISLEFPIPFKLD